MELNITLSKLDYTPFQIQEIGSQAIMRGFSLLDSKDFLRITHTKDSLSKLSQMIRIIRAIKKVIEPICLQCGQKGHSTCNKD